MNKEQIAHDLALLVVEARLRDYEAEQGHMGIHNYSDQALDDYKEAYRRILENLD